MKIKIYILSILLCSSFFSSGQTFCLSFGNPQITNNGTQFEFDLRIERNNVPFQLGSSNLVFNFNQSGLSNPVLLSHSLPMSYDTPTVTNPLLGRASMNIVLHSDNNGLMIATTPTVLGRVRFNIINPSLLSNNNWLYNGGTTQTVVFDDTNPGNQLFATNTSTSCLQTLNVPLPVDLTKLTAYKSDKNIVVYWETQYEHSLSHYEVYKSENGIDFFKIGIVLAKNNANAGSYQYVDTEVASGIQNYYKLKMVDLDEGYTFSNICMAKIDAKELLVYLFPNPVSRNSPLEIKGISSENYEVKIYDQNGSLVTNIALKGHHLLDISSLNTGVFYYSIVLEHSVVSGKLIVFE